MKRNAFIEYCGKYCIEMFIARQLGGPNIGCSSHNDPARDYYEQLAENVEYVAVRPFENLDMDTQNIWKYSDNCKKYFTGKLAQKYTEFHCFLPQFKGSGVLYTLVGSHEIGDLLYRFRMGAHWAPLKSGTSIKEVLGTVKKLYGPPGFYCGLKTFESRARNWKLDFILKTSWDSQNPERSRFEIFIPSKKWVEEHATFAKE